MATYAIYKYTLSKISEYEASQYADESKDTPLELAQEAFDGIFRGELPLRIYKKGKDGTDIILDNEIVHKRDRVTVLLVCNEKQIKYTEKKDEREFSSHPGCYVIIDNRENVAQIAIERTSAFSSKPDSVRNLLQDAINKKIAAYRLRIEIRGKVRETPFWEIVNQRVNEKDSIKWIKFNFGVPEESAGIDASDEMKAVIRGFNRLGKIIGAEKGQYMYNASAGGTLHIDQTEEDMAQLIHYCSTNAYDIQVKFSKYGLYRFGHEERAMPQMDDDVLDGFRTGQLVPDKEGNPTYELLLWLDDAKITYEDYKDATPAKKRRKKSFKKSVA